jgi:hypothetical protein
MNDISGLAYEQSGTNYVSNVIAAMEANAGTVDEIVHSSGLKAGEVRKVLAFLSDFGLVRLEGSRIVIESELSGLPRV